LQAESASFEEIKEMFSHKIYANTQDEEEEEKKVAKDKENFIHKYHTRGESEEERMNPSTYPPYKNYFSFNSKISLSNLWTALLLLENVLEEI